MHAENWRLHYRGAFSDTYLDEVAPQERLSVWTERLRQPEFRNQTFLLFVADQLAGFICLQPYHDVQFGTLLDNLHVGHDYLGQGYGKILLCKGAQFAQSVAPEAGIYLYVLCQNQPAIAFYEKHGGQREGTVSHRSPADDEVKAYRYVWHKPEHLLGYT